MALPAMPDAWQVLLDDLQAQGRIARNGPWLHLPGHAATLSDDETALAGALLPLLAEGRYDPPWVRDLARLRGEPEERVRLLLRKLLRRGEVAQVVKDLFYHRDRVRELATLARGLAAAPAGLNAAAFRDATGLGRKRAIQILEFFDRVGYTRRVRDNHVLRGESAYALGKRRQSRYHRRAFAEGIRARRHGRASNPVGGVRRSQVGSTPAAFRHPSCARCRARRFRPAAC